MKILVVGTGTIGAPIAQALAARHEVIRASRKGSQFEVDLDDPESIRRLYAKVGRVDAVVSAAGQAAFKPLLALSDADFALSINSKLMGQVNLVRFGADIVADKGSFTLTSGMASRQATPGATAISMVNSALEGFVRGAALDLPRGIRINAVSPSWVTETLVALKLDPTPGTPAAQVARFYVKAVEGSMTGQVLDAVGAA
jgi:NAD(P)-dependent dehydrogenase (short-subunit alcohol dehydrogenase family)